MTEKEKEEEEVRVVEMVERVVTVEMDVSLHLATAATETAEE